MTRRAGRVHEDHRGSFTKYVGDGDDPPLSITQVASAHNPRVGTIRGLHYQAHPHGETKRLWVASGAIIDVLVDVRDDSPTYGDWTSVELSAREPAVLTVPEGVAHGYQTLEEDTAVTYLISGAFVPEAARTLLWSDPQLNIPWPHEVSSISESDQAGQTWPVTF